MITGTMGGGSALVTAGCGACPLAAQPKKIKKKDIELNIAVILFLISAFLSD